MSNYNELVTILKELLFNRFYPKPEYIRGLLGDGQGNVLVPDRPDYNYVRFSRASSETFEVFNKEVSQPVDGWPVLIGEFPWTPGLVQVVATDWSAYAQTGWGDSVASIQAHAPTHEWPNFIPGSDPLNVYLRAITPMRTQASASGSTSVMVTAYEYDGPTGTNYGWPGLPDLALGAATPATGSMRYMGVYLNPATNTLGVVTGSTTIFTDALEPPRPAWPRGVMPTAYVRLYGGQSQINERDIRDARRLWETTLVFTGSMAAASQATVNAGLDYSQAVTAGTLTNWEPDRAKNTSGATATAGDIGYINEAGEYKTTTTAGAIVTWAYVVTGGANNADITIASAGRRTINYTGSAPAAGDYLTTSTVAGKALAQAYVSPAIMAVCLAAGSGGTVQALLLCNRIETGVFNSNQLLSVAASSDSAFSSTINGTPGATLVYNAPTGNENSIVPVAAGELAALVLWNTSKTPDEYALIQATVIGTNTITPVTAISGWANTEAIQVNSTTVTGTLGGATFFDVQIKDTTVIPALATAVIFEATANDTGGASQFFVHPYGEGVVANAKTQTVTSQVASLSNRKYTKVSLNQRRFCVGFDATGAGTMTIACRLLGYVVAAP
jgi:hypothetical protein